MKLYHAPGSCSQAICIVLQETGINADVIPVDARKHVLADGTSYYNVSELGYVPLLQLEDGTFLREGAVIAQYLADQSPESKLAPAYGSMERYRLMEWLNFLSAEIHKGFIPLLYAVAAGKWLETAKPKLESRYSWIDRQLAGKISDGRQLHDCRCLPVRIDRMGHCVVDEIGVQREHRSRSALSPSSVV